MVFTWTSVLIPSHKKYHMSYVQGKMPNVVDGQTYSKEYKGDDGAGLDALCVQRSAATPGQRVVLIDDLVATGGTLIAGVDLVKGLVRNRFLALATPKHRIRFNRVDGCPAHWCCCAVPMDGDAACLRNPFTTVKAPHTFWFLFAPSNLFLVSGNFLCFFVLFSPPS